VPWLHVRGVGWDRAPDCGRAAARPAWWAGWVLVAAAGLVRWPALRLRVRACAVAVCCCMRLRRPWGLLCCPVAIHRLGSRVAPGLPLACPALTLLRAQSGQR
jgi:hypothetical protein